MQRDRAPKSAPSWVPGRCAQFGLVLAEVSDRPDAMSPDIRRHVDCCLRCQAELASYRKLRRALHGLGAAEVVAPDRGLEELVASFAPDARVDRLPRRRRIGRAGLAGIAAAAATAVGAVVLVLTGQLTQQAEI